MKTLAKKGWVRVLAAGLFCVFLLLSAAATVLVDYARSDGWFRMTSGDGFENTNGCHIYVSDAMWYIAENVRWKEDLYNDRLGSYAGSAFSYTIQRTSGTITADTRTPSSVYVDKMEYGMDYEVTAYDTGEVELHEFEPFTVTGYVNLPVQPYDGCYMEYLIFCTFFASRYYLLAAKVLLVLLEAFCVLLLCIGAAERGRQGRLRRYMRLPWDVVLITGLISLLVFNVLLDDLVYRTMSLLNAYLGIWPDRVWMLANGYWHMVLILISSFLLWYMCGQLGAGILVRHLLLRRIIRWIPNWLFVLGVLGINAFLVLLLALDVGGREPCLFLWGFDALAAIFLLLYLRQAERVRDAAQELARGNLTYKTNVRRLHFLWRALGENLNRIGDGMTQAVEERMRSERMKTELITNVSHDLKTPLTSIINYIDFLKYDDLDEATRREYLEILDKQSARLKKLTEDVIEASKAASGVIRANKEPIDAVELMQQFLGEYAGRFEAAQITPVLSTPGGELTLLADSLLLGRVIDNLISNVVKYAQPGTRAYFDLWETDGKVCLAVKNISRDPLNISEEELMERFVRGDSSRHTEGSGLGLSIARSLTELMGGTLCLILDGDLFKAELSFPQYTSSPLDTKTGAVV